MLRHIQCIISAVFDKSLCSHYNLFMIYTLL